MKTYTTHASSATGTRYPRVPAAKEQASQTVRATWLCRVGNDNISVPVAMSSTIMGRR